MNKQNHKQQKQEWRKRTNPNAPNRGQAFPLIPHGDKGKLPKGGLNVITPANVRQMHLAKAKLENLPITVYHNKKDKDRIKEFMDTIARGIPLSPVIIHKNPDGTWEVVDGRHKIEAYRLLGYKSIPVVTNATVGEIASAISSDYETELIAQPRSFEERRGLAAKAIQAQRGNPLSGENTGAAYDILNPLSAGETQTADILDMKKRQVVKSGDIVTKGGKWKTRISGTDAQLGTHYMEEPHGDKSALPTGLTVVVPPRELPIVQTDVKQAEAKVEAEASEKKFEDKMTELEERLEASESALKKSKEETAKAKEPKAETPEAKQDREYKEKALIIAKDRSAKMRARKEKARLKAEAEREKDRLFTKAGKKGAKAGIELADRVFPKAEEETLEGAKEYGKEGLLIKRQASWRKKAHVDGR